MEPQDSHGGFRKQVVDQVLKQELAWLAAFNASFHSDAYYSFKLVTSLDHQPPHWTCDKANM